MMRKPTPMNGDLTTPKCANGFALANGGDGIRLVATFTQAPFGAEPVATIISDLMFSPTIAKELVAQLMIHLERHEQMVGPIPSLKYIEEAWAEVHAEGKSNR